MGGPLDAGNPLDALRPDPATSITVSCYHPQQDGDGTAKTEDPPPIVQAQIDKLVCVMSDASETVGALEARLDNAGVLSPRPKPVDAGEALEKDKIAPLPVPMAERLRRVSYQIMELEKDINDLMGRLGV